MLTKSQINAVLHRKSRNEGNQKRIRRCPGTAGSRKPGCCGAWRRRNGFGTDEPIQGRLSRQVLFGRNSRAGHDGNCGRTRAGREDTDRIDLRGVRYRTTIRPDKAVDRVQRDEREDMRFTRGDNCGI